ncbi:MAG TPA: Fur family transcriptional regulator [Candidatus Saccharimonadales bacterium]|jgi:Fur family ferric uptake transcriptional regulator
METSQKLTELLGKHGYSMTLPRLRIFEALVNLHEPATVQQLIYSLPALDKVTVYRTIRLFEKIGIVHRVWNGMKSSVELSERFSAHHHHFSCLQCGTSIAIKSDRLEKALHDIEAEYGFDLRQHTVELNGYCSSCKTVLQPE